MLAPTRVFRQFDLPEGGKGADNFFFKNKKTPRRAFTAQILRSIKRPAEQIKISPTMLLFPIDVFFCLLFSMGIGYVLSILYVFFADIKYLYSIVLTLWMYMSAIFYPYGSTTLMMQKVIGNNPVFVYIAFARDCVMYQKWPETDLWIKMILWGIASFLIGYYVFSKKENNVMQKI